LGFFGVFFLQFQCLVLFLMTMKKEYIRSDCTKLLEQNCPEVTTQLFPIKPSMDNVRKVPCTVLITNIEKTYKQIYYF